MTVVDLSSLKFWESVGLWGFVFVWVGVAGEGAEIFTKLLLPKLYKQRQRCFDRIGAFFWVVLVVALATEFLGNVKAMRIADAENTRLDGLASAANERAANVESNNVALSLHVEELRKANAVLEAQISPRRFEQSTPANALRKFSGTKAVIVSATGAECIGLTSQIRYMLEVAHWNVGEVLVTANPVFPGVRVSPCFTNEQTSNTPLSPLKSPPSPEESRRLKDTCEALSSELNKSGIDSQTDLWLGLRARKKFEGIFIVVGAKPTADESEMIKAEAELYDPNTSPEECKNIREKITRLLYKQVGTNSNRQSGGAYNMQSSSLWLP